MNIETAVRDKTSSHNELAVEPTQEGPAAVESTSMRGSRVWLLGAYTFLTLWGMAYLVLFFTDRLPF